MLHRAVQSLSSRLLGIERDLAGQFTPALSPQETTVIKVLYGAGQTNMGNLAGELSIPLSTCTYLIDKLEERGLAVRARTRNDRRAVFVELSETGTRFATQMQDAQVVLCEELLSAFAPDERPVLRQLLDRLAGGEAQDKTAAARPPVKPIS